MVGDIKFREGEAVSESQCLLPGCVLLSFTLLVVPVCLSKGLVWQVFPLHDTVRLESLQAGWVRKLFGLQPLGIYRYLAFH